jgi:hypothetical protein
LEFGRQAGIWRKESQQGSGMRKDYNKIAGQSVERLAALSDGVFAVAMTLLVLDLKGPATNLVHGRILTAQALYALGAALCVIDTVVSQGFILLVQLSYALGLNLPRKKAD